MTNIICSQPNPTMKSQISSILPHRLLPAIAAVAMSAPALSAEEIVHDNEYNFVKAQYQGAWAQQDKQIDAKLAEIR